MRDSHSLATAALLSLALLAPAHDAGGQVRQATSQNQTGAVTVTAGPQFRAGSFTRSILGSGWRDIWTTPLIAPVLDIDTFAGGLKLTERGGGFHSLVLHLDEENGWREYRFRSVTKFPMQGMPPALKGTAVGALLEDQVSILFPAAPLLVPPLLRAVGILHVDPELYVMGDSPRLKQVRDTVVGMLGTFELKAEEGPDDQPGFAGSRSIKGTEKFYEDLDSSRAHRPDEREYLAARLVDFLINDPDRTPDNYDWVRFGEKGAYTWRPLPRDRDQAFINAHGLINQLVIRRVYPKVIAFTPKYPLKGLTYTSHVLDRRLLQRLSADDFRDVALRVQRAAHDTVIAQVVAKMPAEWRAATTVDERLTSLLRARREGLPDVAMGFYRQLAREVDVHGTDEPDRLEIVRHDDGRVTVIVTDPVTKAIVASSNNGRVVTTSDGSVARPGTPDVFYQRTFEPGETKEIRLYASGGDDVAVVRGVASGPIKVRIIGGKGDDVLADSAGGGDTFLYDAEGKNLLVSQDDTHIDTRPWKPMRAQTGFRRGGDWRPDWGGSSGWKPVLDHKSGNGIIVGVGPRFRSYGFRRLPYHWEAGASAMISTFTGRAGLTADADYREENSPRAFRVEARATQLEATRFFGYGNNTPDVDSSLSLVNQTVVSFEPSVVLHIGWRKREGEGNAARGEDTTRYSGLRPLVGELRLGTRLGWIDPQPELNSPLQTSGVRGSEDFALAGAVFGLELDRTDDDAVPTSGFKLNVDLAGYPMLWDLDQTFGTALARGSLYVPLGKSGGPHLAFRAGGALASGAFPAQFAAAIGGRSSLRGYSWRRYAGDVAANGGAEIRVPVGTVNFLVRSQLGVFGLADVGRVWFDSQSDGGWHSGVGGGFWLSALGHSVSFAYAHGESGRLYVRSGLFY